ncbi:MAG: DUF454 family protein [Bacteroidales bacterium]|jgi:hypothetical protein|nr:DUF454 family protein [Bacteroidales bacterium]
MIKILLITGGTLSLIGGLTGIFIPILPTTPFVLLSAGMYYRSSTVLYEWMKTNRITSRHLKHDAGRPYFENEDSMTAGPGGPALLQDYYLHEKLVHFNWQKVPASNTLQRNNSSTDY